jgi:hypothetical protein
MEKESDAQEKEGFYSSHRGCLVLFMYFTRRLRAKRTNIKMKLSLVYVFSRACVFYVYIARA